MKLKIKVKEIVAGCMPRIIDKGDWIDLRAARAVSLKRPAHNKFQTDMIPLGVAMKLPEGFEAIVAPRSSTFKNFGIMIPNSFGVIDQSYCGNSDEWKLPVICINNCDIMQFERVCQFRIQPSQKATFWQKLKWLFSSGIKIERVDNLGNKIRGGFGSTGRN